MKLAIIGSRGFTDYEKARRVFVNFFEKFTTTIVSGGARGADSIGRDLAKEFNLEYIEHIPDWEGLGKGAGHARNTKIINDCQMALVFYDGASRGTQDSLNKLKEQKKPVFIIYF